MSITVIKNSPGWPGTVGYIPPTIEITKADPNWKEAYQNWISMKNPSDSKAWKKGVFAS